MKIVADRDIFQITEFFSPLGELVLLPGREITQDSIMDADALLVRTVTQVDRELVENSRLAFVGSASSGFDHIDRDWLKTAGIDFAHAPGCNADAVVNYVITALAWLSANALPAKQKHMDWRECSVGIVGAGHVGGRLARALKHLGMKVAIYDPFLDNAHALAGDFSPLEDVLQRDIVSLHTPLTRTGPHPAFHLLDETALAGLREGCILINASRGAVIDNSALNALLAQGKDLVAVLDVWEGEPVILDSLVDKVAIATPHIAGYSLNGKRNATETVYQKLCQSFSFAGNGAMTNREVGELSIPESESEIDFLNNIILQAYPIRNDFIGKPGHSGKKFDRLRNGYPFRPEFSDYRIRATTTPGSLAQQLAVLGFRFS